MDYREPSNIGSLRGITSSVRFLLILNIAVYVLEVLFRIPLSGIFALHSDWIRQFAFGQLFTYMFIHANLGHLLMNMITLYFIGPPIERTLGSYRFFILYYVSGILGGLGWSLLATQGICLGASGAIMGVLGALAALYPNAELMVIFFPFFPIKAWKLVLALACIELFQTIVHPIVGGIANAAHLMGGIAGFVYALTLRRPQYFRDLLVKLRSGTRRTRNAARPAAGSAALSKTEIDQILDKIGKQGMGALSVREREMLKRATRG